MKKLSILFAAVVLMAMTACNEKPSKANADGNQPATTEQTEPSSSEGDKPRIDVDKAAPTADGKDHTVAEFNTKEYQIRLENLADGTYRVSLWNVGKDKNAEPDQKIETKQCVMKNGGYLMKASDGKIYVINTKAGAESITIMNNKEIIYNGGAGK